MGKEYQNTFAGPTKIVTLNNSSDKSSKLDTIVSKGGRSGRGARGGARGGRGGRGGKRPPQEKEYQNTSAGPTTSAKLNTSTTSSSKMTTPEEDEAAAAKHEFYQSAAASTAALKIQSMFYKSRGKSNDLATRHKRHKAEVALALAQTLRGGGLVPDVLEGIQEGIQGEIDGAIEGETAAATGDTAGDEVEADTGNIDVVNLPGMNLKMGAGSIGNKFRILIGWLQITAALVISFDIPWPPVTLNLFKGLTFINFNFMDFFAPLEPCTLYTPFLKQAAFHMSILPLCILMVLPAAILAMSCQKARVVKERAGSMLVTIIFLLYPGIVTRVVSALKCKQIGEKSYLVADYSVVCWEGEHAEYATAMAFFSIIYVVGIPLGTSALLHCNRKLLHPDEIDPENTALRLKAESFGQVYGSLYEAYDPEYYWFETLIMIQKALLTGGLVLVAPGSSTQILVGLVIALTFYSVLLKTQPYADNTEDTMQSIATASTVMTLLIGFALKATLDQNKSSGMYDMVIMDVILVGMFTLVAVSGLYMILISLPCCGGDDSGGEELTSKKQQPETLLTPKQVRNWTDPTALRRKPANLH